MFSNITPNNPQISQAYCEAHTPTVVVASIEQITSKTGALALNGIKVNCISYKAEQKDHLFFNSVEVIISGKEQDGKSWSTPMKLYEQSLYPVGVTSAVWSTPQCRGTFLGTPTIIK